MEQATEMPQFQVVPAPIISDQWTTEERLIVVEALTQRTLDMLYESSSESSAQPAKNVELAWSVSCRPADQLEGRRDEILRAAWPDGVMKKWPFNDVKAD